MPSFSLTKSLAQGKKAIILNCLLAVFIGCSTKGPIDPSIEIQLEFPGSYKYDVKNEIYTVYFMEKPPLEVKFHLSDDEVNRIINKYYDLGINKLSQDLLIRDNCLTMPKVLTALRVKTKKQVQRIQIDEDCDDFKFSNSGKANRVKTFMKFIRDIIGAKPEVQKAPKSDFIYM